MTPRRIGVIGLRAAGTPARHRGAADNGLAAPELVAAGYRTEHAVTTGTTDRGDQ
ncbi:hypothetical protein [Streptomyces sp. NPDC053542]|uniref:hypothetical protein n=1 Tax=Streptomyces sp. NPDC053542 TaxID=3365710 RepID=UPI0037CFDCA9